MKLCIRKAILNVIIIIVIIINIIIIIITNCIWVVTRWQ
jgi:hypothetical protein